MRILFLAPDLPYPPRAGAAIRNLHLIKALATAHQLSLLTFSQPDRADSSPDSPNPLFRLCEKVVTAEPPTRPKWRRLLEIPGPAPDLARRLASTELKRLGEELVRSQAFEIVHIGAVEMAPLGFYLAAYHQKFHRARPKIVLDEHNAEYVLQRRAFENELRPGGSPVGGLYSLLQYVKLKRYETGLVERADGVIVVSEADRQAIARISPRLARPEARLVVIPNPIDIEDYPLAGRRFEEDKDGDRPDELQVVFTGKMDFRPNVDAVVWFCEEVWPLVRKRSPRARFLVVGRDPTEKVRALGKREGVTVTGAVPDDRPYLEAASVFVVPMRVGGGVRIKVLQAMAAGIPLVATSLGYEGVAARPDEHLLVGDSPEELADAILWVPSHPSECHEMTRRARQLVESRYDWRALKGPILDFYARVAVEN